jgi:hypothetical protein
MFAGYELLNDKVGGTALGTPPWEWAKQFCVSWCPTPEKCQKACKCAQQNEEAARGGVVDNCAEE